MSHRVGRVGAVAAFSGGGPEQDAAGFLGHPPLGEVFEAVVGFAEVGEVVAVGVAAAGPGVGVVDVAGDRGAGAAREPAGLVAHSEPFFHGFGVLVLGFAE